MKSIYYLLFAAFILAGCRPKVDDAAKVAFERNSETVSAYLEGFESESIDYDAIYSTKAIMCQTRFGSKDSVNLEKIKKIHREGWKYYDFELLAFPVTLLPGVNRHTKKPDGSVRYYADWKITRQATDSTAARSGVIKYHELFEFDEDGKIICQLFYADATGLEIYLESD